MTRLRVEHFYAAATTRSYSTQARTLLRLCSKHHVPIDSPFSDTDLCFLLDAYAETHKVTTVPMFLSAIQHFARVKWGVEYSVPKGRLLFETLGALKLKHASTAASIAKTPITLADLVAFHATLDRRYFEHARTWCAALLGFFGLLRIGEYCDGALFIGDVSEQPYGLDIVIRRSKTSAQPPRISLAERPDALCPVAALRHVRVVLRPAAHPLAHTTHCLLSASMERLGWSA